MTRRVFRSILLVAICVLLASLTVVAGVVYGYFAREREAQLRVELELAARAVERMGADYLYDVRPGDCRITWTAADGEVIYDTRRPANEMENHADREEIIEAIATGEGASSRYSDTLMEQMYYFARRLDDGSVLRVAASQSSVLALVINMIKPLLAISAAAVILSLILSKGMAKRIVTPLNQLDLDNPLDNDAYEELAPLLTRINRQHEQIAAQLKELKRKNDEFGQITASMNEALTLLDDKGIIISMNARARKLFGVDGDPAGRDFLTVERSPAIDQALKKAMEKGGESMSFERDGREYAFDISRIESQGTVMGAAILAFDVTERSLAQRNRRQFTANVSHELKTPLQSIMGSAEVIENGLVKPQDMPRFISRIREESQRLVTLIDDIMRLSRLDEGEELPIEDIDLYEIARQTMTSLSLAAADKNVAMTLDGESAHFKGVRRLVCDIAYNLLDNAIKYNVESGKVVVTVNNRADEAVITVADTGAGIASEHLPRVFERFYRADESHSKKTGGTGLGLSIVKHAAAYHNARINMTSEPGEGTEISVAFPTDHF